MVDPVLACLVELALNDDFRRRFAEATASKRVEMISELGDLATLPKGFIDLVVSDNHITRREAFANYLDENIQISGGGDQRSMLRALNAFLATTRGPGGADTKG